MTILPSWPRHTRPPYVKMPNQDRYVFKSYNFLKGFILENQNFYSGPALLHDGCISSSMMKTRLSTCCKRKKSAGPRNPDIVGIIFIDLQLKCTQLWLVITTGLIFFFSLRNNRIQTDETKETLAFYYLSPFTSFSQVISVTESQWR